MLTQTETSLGPTVLPVNRAIESNESPAARLLRAADGGSVRLGVIIGHGYRNLRGDIQRLRTFLSARGDIPFRLVQNPADVGAALDAYADAAVDLVLVSGGDGTISMVATDLIRKRHLRNNPVLALLEGGRTNMTAGDVGLRGDQVRNLKRVLAWAAAPRLAPSLLCERPAIGIGSPGGPETCGFFVGGGAVYQASLDTWSFRDRSRLPGMKTGLGTAVNVVRMVSSHLVGRNAFPPTPMQLSVDGAVTPEGEWCCLLATTLRRMALGIFPFWADNSGPIRVTGIAAQHSHLLRAAMGALRGKPNRHLTPTRGYHSLNAETVDIKLHDGVTLDGEIIRPEREELHMRVSGRVVFFRPASR